MLRTLAILFAIVVGLGLTIRSTPRACGSIFACCDARASVVVNEEPSCCPPSGLRGAATHPTTHPASDEAMACCMPLATIAPVEPAANGVVRRTLDRLPLANGIVETRTLEPATPPPRVA